MLAKQEEVGLEVLDVEYREEIRKRELVWPAIAAAERAAHTASQALGKADDKVFWVFRNRLIATVWAQASKCKDAYFEEEKEVRVLWEPPWEPNKTTNSNSVIGQVKANSRDSTNCRWCCGAAAGDPAIMLGPQKSFDQDDVKRIVAENRIRHHPRSDSGNQEAPTVECLTIRWQGVEQSRPDKPAG